MSAKPIRIFFSPLSRRFYATAHYREGGRGEVTVTGKKYDVTNDIAALIEENDVTFVKRPEENDFVHPEYGECEQ